MKSQSESKIEYGLVEPETGKELCEYMEYVFCYSEFLEHYCAYLYALAKDEADVDLEKFTSYKEFIEFMVSLEKTTTQIAELLIPLMENREIYPKRLQKVTGDIDELRYQLLFAKVRTGLFSDELSTPSYINALAIELLDLREGETVADFGCGEGTFLTQAAVKVADDNIEFLGMDTYSDAAVIAMIRASLLNASIKIEVNNMFDDKYVFDDKYTYTSFDKIFSNYPLGVKLEHLQGKSAYLGRVKQGLPEYGRPTSSDWVFNRLLSDSLKKGGKAIGVMTNGSALNSLDQKIRKYFVDNGMIEGVIALPANLLSYTSIPLCLVVLSHNNEGIRFVDATDEFEKGRRQNTLSKENISNIVNGYFHDSEMSKFVSNDEIAADDYVLSPASFVQEEIIVENATPLDELMLSITRGASIAARKLDKMTVKHETNCQHLLLSDISDGRISTELPYLDELDPKLDKYCIETGDLLLSKNGAPYKVAVANVPEGKKILANGNLYIIKLDTKKVNPNYVAAYLQSEIGKALLSRLSVGTTTPNLSLLSLKKIPIPMKPLEEQERIATCFEEKLDLIGVLKTKLEQARQEVVKAFDKER